MANHASALKRQRQSEKTRLRYKAKRSQVQTAIKNVLQADTKEKAQDLFKKAQSLIAKFGQTANIHKKNASRIIAKLSRAVSKK